MDTELIQTKILTIMKRCNIKSFPIDCFAILKKLEIPLYPYSSLSANKQQQCFLISDDAFILADAIYYNDLVKFDSRRRFSLMHELGHITLNHKEQDSPQKEQEANFFASHLLAPRMLIHYSGCKNAQDVAQFFQLSLEASDYAFRDYRRWHRMAAYRLTMADQAIYDYFYSPDIKKFAYDTHPCAFCERNIYNQPDKSYCTLCQGRSSAQSPIHPFSAESRIQSYAMEQWNNKES